MHLNFLDVCILCDDQPLEEYAVQNEGAQTKSCFIPSESGKSFSVTWWNDLDSAVSVECRMDGRSMGRSSTKPRREGARSGVRTGPETRQSYQFAPITVTDDDTIADPDPQAVAELGIIEVRVFRVTITPSYGGSMPLYRTPFIVEHGPVHERTKKAGAHCVSLGQGVSCAPHIPTSHTTYLDKRDRPFARFIFRYRPRGLLQAEGILPRGEPSHAERAPSDRAPSQRRSGPVGLTSESMPPRKRQRRNLVKLEARPDRPPSIVDRSSDIINIESDPEEERAAASARVKREARLKCEKLVILEDGVIDLTGD